MSDELGWDAVASELAEGGSDDVDLVEPWGEEPPEAELHRARTRVMLRGVMFVVVTAISLWCVFGIPTTDEFLYYLQGADTPTDLGDLRARRAAGEQHLPFEHNTYVKLAGQVMTYEAETENGGENFFFDPLYAVITRTERPLPEKIQYRSVGIPSDLVWLIEKRRAFAEDLTVSFAGEGRLVRADKSTRWSHIYRAYERTIPHLPPASETWLLLDGGTPQSYWPFALAYGVAVLLVLMTGFFFFRALRGYGRLRREWQ